MRGHASLVAFALIVLTTAVSGRERPRDTQTLSSAASIGIYDYAGVHSEQLSRARRAVDRLFTGVDVRITWLGPYRSSDLQPHSRFESPTPRPDLAVLILNAKMTKELRPQANSLGCAPGTTLARGRIAYVFYDRLANLMGAGESVVNVLSLVMAHEIGHLLLPYGSHSETGVMRSRWSATELQLADVAGIGFTSSQIEAMRAGVLRNDADDLHAKNLNSGKDE